MVVLKIIYISGNFNVDKECFQWKIRILDNIRILRGQLLNKTCKLIFLSMVNEKLGGIEPYTFYNVNITEIDLRGNYLRIIKQNTFVNANVYRLNLSNNKINVIEKNAFQNLTNLKNLDLSSNDLREINGNEFVNLGSVMYFNVSYNRIEKVSKQIFKIFSREFTFLCYLNNNEICELEEDIFEFISNDIRTVSLNLSCNKLDYIGENTFNLLNLSGATLILNNNFMYEIPKSVYEANMFKLSCLNCPNLKKENVQNIKIWSKKNKYDFVYSNGTHYWNFWIYYYFILLIICNLWFYFI